MKRFALLFLVVALVGAGSYGVTRLVAPKPSPDEDQVAWIAREFKLNAAQSAQVEKLHFDYIPVCSDHCAMIVAAREKSAAHPADATLKTEVTRLEQVCQSATLQHVRQVAACMDPEQGRRFLALVEPRIVRHEHHAPFGLK